MVTQVNGPVNAPSQPAQTQGRSALIELVVVVALGALALIAAHSCEYEAPGLALFLRCVPIGLSLIWLFRNYVVVPGVRYIYTSHQPTPVIIHQTVPQPAPRSNWWNFWSNSRTLYTAPATRQQPFVVQNVPVHAPTVPFPAVQVAPAQPSAFVQQAQPVQTMPVHGPSVPFPPVQPAPAQSFVAPPVQQMAAPAPVRQVATPVAAPTFAPMQAQNTSVATGSFPAVRAAPAQPASSVQPTQQAAPMGGNPGNDRILFKAAATRS